MKKNELVIVATKNNNVRAAQARVITLKAETFGDALFETAGVLVKFENEILEKALKEDIIFKTPNRGYTFTAFMNGNYITTDIYITHLVPSDMEKDSHMEFIPIEIDEDDNE